MSEPPNTSALIPHDHHHHHYQHHRHQQQPPPPQVLPQQLLSAPITNTTSATTSSLIREYRKGNWTLHETLVLITAKKLDDERRTKGNTTPPVDPTNKNQSSSSSSSTSCRTAELRWKWVENYCWKNGCMRSQNQCNDKWDNLLRDYKKVREYESRSVEGSATDGLPSYWQMQKHERKEKSLPTNLLSEVFEALNEVVHRRYQQQQPPPPPLQPKSSPSKPSNTIIATPITTTTTAATFTTTTPPPPSTVTVALPCPLPPPPPPPVPPPAETSDSSETEGSERILETDTKHRRKVRKLGSSIEKSASVLVKTLIECEEKKEKRHQNLIQLEERRLEIEETRNEVNKQGFASLIAAVNNLSGAIQALVSNRQNTAT